MTIAIECHIKAFILNPSQSNFEIKSQNIFLNVHNDCTKVK